MSSADEEQVAELAKVVKAEEASETTAESVQQLKQDARAFTLWVAGAAVALVVLCSIMTLVMVTGNLRESRGTVETLELRLDRAERESTLLRAELIAAGYVSKPSQHDKKPNDERN